MKQIHEENMYQMYTNISLENTLLSFLKKTWS